jgi:hypothetical protein
MPASYPTSVKTFTTKQNGAGNTIFAAHVNDIQDEVVAIESGLTQGTAPLASSNSTVANLSVLGNSTVAGALGVGGAASLTTVSVSGGSTFATLINSARTGTGNFLNFVGDTVLRGGFFQENAALGLEFTLEASADMTAPGTNGARLYTKDNGGGKTQLVVRFASGAVQVLATEP